MVMEAVDNSSVPPVETLYQFVTHPEGGVETKLATVPLPQKLCAEAVGDVGKVLMVTETEVRVLLTQPVDAVLASA